MSASLYHEALAASAEEIGGHEWVSLRRLAAFLECPYDWLITVAYSSSLNRACEATFPGMEDVKLQSAALPVLLVLAAGPGCRIGTRRFAAAAAHAAGFSEAMWARVPEFEPMPLGIRWDDRTSLEKIMDGDADADRSEA